MKFVGLFVKIFDAAWKVAAWKVMERRLPD
jgi:hypothetical protein